MQLQKVFDAVAAAAEAGPNKFSHQLSVSIIRQKRDIYLHC